jgi:hypothetical protein
MAPAGKPIRDPKTKKVIGYELPDLKTIELLWHSMGRLSAGKEEGQVQVNVSSPSMIQDREDAIAAMQLLAERRRELAKRKAIETTAIEVGTA